MKCGSCHEFPEVQNIINVHTLSHFYHSFACTVLSGLTGILLLLFFLQSFRFSSSIYPLPDV